MCYFIADNHFGHKNIIAHCNRPFNSVDKMDQAMINNWNTVIDGDDIIIIAGDIFLCHTAKMFEVINQLNGYKILVRGNHDTQSRTKLIRRLGFDELYDNPYYIKVPNIGRLIVTHCPLPDDELGPKEFNIHGHTHNLRPNDDKHFCVSAEMIDYTPIHLNEIIEYFINPDKQLGV